MKTLFILVSTLAFLYLIAQTSLVQEQFQRISTYSLSGKAVAQATPSESSANAEQLNALSQKFTEISHTNEQLQNEIVALKQQVMQLSSTTSMKDDIASFANTSTDVESALSASAANDLDKNTIMSTVNRQSDTTAEILSSEIKSAQKRMQPRQDSTANATNLSKNMQQKRLQQQAVLRDLAVKMELSALQSLSR